MRVNGTKSSATKESVRSHEDQNHRRNLQPEVLKAVDPTISNSISDSNVNCVNRLLTRNSHLVASKLWEVGKRIGVSYEGDETEIVERIKGIQETKLEVIEAGFCAALWGNQDFEWDFNPSLGRSGGILCIWNKRKFGMTDIYKGAGFIAVKGVWYAGRKPCVIVTIYSPRILFDKRSLLAEILNLMNLCNFELWCVMGDFNTVKESSERIGRALSDDSRGMRLFNKWVDEMELVDLPLIGRKFTYYQGGGGVMSRIDKILLSAEWLTCWPEASQLMVRKIWGETNIQGWHVFVLKEKLKVLKGEIRRWNREVFGCLDRQVEDLKKQMADFDYVCENQGLSDSQLLERRKSLVELWKVASLKENLIVQKLRSRCQRNGDANTSFFHACINGRRRANQIMGIRVGGAWLEDDQEIIDSVKAFFESSFKKDQVMRPRLEGYYFTLTCVSHLLPPPSTTFSLPPSSPTSRYNNAVLTQLTGLQVVGEGRSKAGFAAIFRWYSFLHFSISYFF
ncbi:hypothetical protein RIF29_09513 [Crotalaria pallida]|uniref:Uncharacterized protein n=1 Tax=Crotalaria pallida TaxID=3830 RepID=A0AAN9FY49_CROPI